VRARTTLLCLALLLQVVANVGLAQEDSRRPNIVIIMADDK